MIIEDFVSSDDFERKSSQTGFFGMSSIKHEQEYLDLAGVSKETFNLLLKIILRDYENCNMKTSPENQLSIFLIRMKSGLTFSALGVSFAIHRTTASRIFYSLLNYLYGACQHFVFFPSSEVVQETMPDVFKNELKNARVIIDCTEFFVDQPARIDYRVQYYSSYKKGFRLKILIGCTPAGFISFVLNCYGGRATDCQITNDCGFLNLLEPRDIVLADKGFPTVATAMNNDARDILIVMPPFRHGDGCFSENEVHATYNIAKVRIHVERIMQRIRTYKIVDHFTTDMLCYYDKIVFMACVLVNLQPPIIKEK